MALSIVYILIMQLREEVGHFWAQRIRDGLAGEFEVYCRHRRSPCTLLGALEKDDDPFSVVVVGDPFRLTDDDQQRLIGWSLAPGKERTVFIVGELPPLLTNNGGNIIETTPEYLAEAVAEALYVLRAKKGG